MPKTDSAAMASSRRHGSQYPRIDALWSVIYHEPVIIQAEADTDSTIQDNNSDWEQEAPRITSLYSEADVIYSILGSKGDEQDFIARRECPV